MNIRMFASVLMLSVVTLYLGETRAVSAPASQFVSNWCHNKNNFKATTGENIKIDFQFQPQNTHGNMLIYISPLWLNIRSKDFTGSESVRAVLIPFNFSSRDTVPKRSNEDLIALDLAWDANEHKFTASSKYDVLISVYGNGSDTTYYKSYDVAVVIDGRWLNFGSEGSHNIMLNPNSADEVICD